jgi:thioredoxin reductase (NADPH)
VAEKIIAVTPQGEYQAKSLLFATGARYRKINAPGEEKFFGRGIDYSATCPGYNYKNKNVLVVGGGDTALTEALYLYNLGAMVTLLHRHNALTGEKKLQDIVSKTNISVVLNSVVEEIMGHDIVTAVKTRDLVRNTVTEIPIDGIINAIGKIPNSDLARDIGIEMYDMGFIKTDRYHRTNIPRIYATGEVTGGVRKVTTSLEEGATVAFSCLEDLTNYK